MTRKKVRIVPVVGANDPVEVELPDDTSVGDAIVQAFPNVSGNLVIQDDANRPLSPSAQLRDAREIRFMPYTTGGL